MICAYEDRPSDFVGLKLLALSVLEHHPEAKLTIFCPATDELKGWFAQYPQVTLRDMAGGRGWNVKPDVLLAMLEDHPEALWIDSDIIVTRPFHHLIGEGMVAAQGHRWESNSTADDKSKAWRLKGHGGQNLNSCFLKVTREHTGLLKKWRDMLEEFAYLEAQNKPATERPEHLMGDQDVLTALVNSTSTHVRFIKRGKDIAQCFHAYGYTAGERLRNVFTLPPLVHAQGPKPWRKDIPPQLRPILATSPYPAVARKYRERLHENTDWMDAKPDFEWLGANLRGLPMALKAQSSRIGVRSVIRRILRSA